jgi:hypothetical protein
VFDIFVNEYVTLKRVDIRHGVTCYYNSTIFLAVWDAPKKNDV